MALQNNFVPSTSLVFGVRDFAPQISELGNINTKALQNAFNFGTKVYDWDKDRKIAKELRQENPDVNKMAALEASKINGSQDPTSIWRWKKSLDALEAQRTADLQRIKEEKELQAAREATNAAYDINATLDTIFPDAKMSFDQGQQYINTLGSLEAQARKHGLEKELKRIRDLRDQVGMQMGVIASRPVEQTTETTEEVTEDPAYTGTQSDVWSSKAEELLADKNATIKDFTTFKQELKNNGVVLPNDLLTKVNSQHTALINRAKKKAEDEEKAIAREKKILALNPNGVHSDDVKFMEKRGYRRMMGETLADTKWVKVK